MKQFRRLRKAKLEALGQGKLNKNKNIVNYKDTRGKGSYKGIRGKGNYNLRNKQKNDTILKNVSGKQISIVKNIMNNTKGNYNPKPHKSIGNNKDMKPKDKPKDKPKKNVFNNIRKKK